MVEPLTRFGASAFGPLRARAVSADGVPGDWLPLGTLVRVPVLHELRCPHNVNRPCTLIGSNLFLLDSVAASQDFANPTEVPPDFTGAQLTVPHPVNGALYLKLRDDPDTVQTLTMPVTPLTPSPSTAGVESSGKTESKPEQKTESKTELKPETKAEHQDQAKPQQ
jgi:hypothetical protein